MANRRRWISAGVMLGLIFAQIVTAAHACPNLIPPSEPAVVQTSVEKPSCHDSGNKAKDNAKICEVHCLAGVQVDSHADTPAAAIAPREGLAIPVVDLSALSARDVASLCAYSATAPPLLRFGRLLI